MPDKVWSDEEKVAAIQGFLKYKKFIHNAMGTTTEDYWQKITAMVQAKAPADYKVKNGSQVYKKICNIKNQGYYKSIYSF